MAKQTGLVIVGRRENIIYYQWKGGYYMRAKSTLTRKRVLQEPAFARSRVRAKEFGVASRLARDIFRLLPKVERKRGVMGSLTGRAHRFLMHGKSLRETRELLLELVEQLLPKAVLRKYRRQHRAEKNRGITRQQQWVGDAEKPGQMVVTTTGTLQQQPTRQDPASPPGDSESSSPPDG